MRIHKLDLSENAVDSFNEALQKYRQGAKGDVKAYKFAILHYSHFLELIFKYYVSQSHELLIYKNPFSKNVDKEPTIGLWEAVQFLKNEGRDISEQFRRDLEWIKKLRNDIEHHRFEMDVGEVRRTLGRLTQALDEFNSTFGDIDFITERIDSENLGAFDELADEYKSKLATARIEAREDSTDGKAYSCPHCENKETAARDERGFMCAFCGERDDLVECVVCGDRLRATDGMVWNDDHAPAIDYICESCYDRITNM